MNYNSPTPATNFNQVAINIQVKAKQSPGNRSIYDTSVEDSIKKSPKPRFRTPFGQNFVLKIVPAENESDIVTPKLIVDENETPNNTNLNHRNMNASDSSSEFLIEGEDELTDVDAFEYDFFDEYNSNESTRVSSSSNYIILENPQFID